MMTHELFNRFSDALIADLHASGRTRTASAYLSAANSFRSLLCDIPPGRDLFSAEGLRLYEQRLCGKGLCPNTTSFYMRMLRAIYNKGVSHRLCAEQAGLFSAVYTGIDATPKRAVSPSVFGALQQLDLSAKKNLAFARDLFLLSYSLQGISFVDLAFLRKSDLKDSILSYRRAKTGSPIVIPLSPFARQIIDFYTPLTEGSPYLLPLISDPEKDARLQYESGLRTYNRRLKTLAEMGGIAENLTSYTARHTWATTALREDVPIGVISQAMGHKTEEVTRIYLANFDHSAISRANEKVLMAANLVSFPCPEATVLSSCPERTDNNNQQNNLASDHIHVGMDTKKNVRHLSGDGHFRCKHRHNI